MEVDSEIQVARNAEDAIDMRARVCVGVWTAADQI